MSEWLPGTSKFSTAVRVLLLLLLIGMPLWVAATSHLARMVLAVGCYLLLLLVLRQGSKVYRPPGLLPFALFCGWLLVQAVPLPPFLLELLIPVYIPQLKQGLWELSPGVWHSLSLFPAATLGEFFRFSAYLAFYLAVSNLLISGRGQRRLLLWLSGFVGLYAFCGLIQFFSPTERIFWFFSSWPEAGRFFATYVNGNHYAAFIGMVFPLLVICLMLNLPHAGYGSLRERIADIFTDNELNRAIMLGLVTIIAAVSVFFSLSRSGTMTLFLSSLILLFLLVGREHLRGRMLVFLSVLVAAVGLLAFFGWDPLLERFARTFNAAGELQTQRLTYWLDSINLFRAAPLTGSGAGTFIDAYPAWQTALTRDLIVDHAHNDYVEMLTDLGLIGFSLVLWFWVDFLRSVIPAWSQRRNRTARLICAGSFAGLASIMLHSFTDFNLAIPANGLYLFLLFGLFAAASHSSSNHGQNKVLLPLLGPVSRKIFFTSGSALLFLTLLVSGGEEIAAANFSAVVKINLQTASSSELLAVKAAAETSRTFAPLQPKYSFSHGMVLGRLGELQAGLEDYRRALWLRPEHVEYQLQIARTLFALDRSERAEKVLRNTLKIKPFNWISYRELASFLLAAERKAEGLSVLKSGLALRPEMTKEVIRLLIVAGVSHDEFFRAIPERSRSWAILGDFFSQLDEQDRADRAYRRGVDVLRNETPADAFILWRYLDFLGKSKRNAEALQLLRTATGIFPRNQYFLARQGVLYEKEGLRDRAIEAYRTSILIDPRSDWVRKRLEKLETGAGH